MGNHHHRLRVITPNFEHILLQLRTSQGIQSTKGFVEQEHFRTSCQGAGDSHPLLHPPRQFIGIFIGGGGESDHFDMLIDDRNLVCSAGSFEHFIHRHANVFADG